MATIPVLATANDFLERQLDERIEAVEKQFHAHGLAYSGPLLQGVDDLFREVIEKRYAAGGKSNKLVVLLTILGYLLMLRILALRSGDCWI